MKQLPDFDKLPKNWWESVSLFREQLLLLKKAGITGLRLNIFNSELTTDASTITWQPLEFFLKLAEQVGLEIHLCLGPYQYPLWPGIRLPDAILPEKRPAKMLDRNKKWREFGTGFLEEELKRYGKDKRISGFYLGNEWHTTQRIENFSKKNETFTVSPKYMESLARLCKRNTKKPIFFNTNLQPHQLKKIEHFFLAVTKILRNQAWLGLDLYPSQESFSKAPLLALHRKVHPFVHDIEQLKKKFIQRVLISEFEAQPWGNGKSWYAQIKTSPSTVSETAQQLLQTFPAFISAKQFDQATFWGAEFWLLAYRLGHTEMLDTVQQLSQ